MDHPYEVTSDGRTVWINQAMCVARFGMTGYEIGDGLVTAVAQKGSEAGFTTPADWKDFVDLVKTTFGVTVDESHKPERLAGPPPWGT